MILLIIMIQVSFAHESHGLGDRKDFKYQDSWTVKLLRHLTGNWFFISLLFLYFINKPSKIWLVYFKWLKIKLVTLMWDSPILNQIFKIQALCLICSIWTLIQSEWNGDICAKNHRILFSHTFATEARVIFQFTGNDLFSVILLKISLLNLIPFLLNFKKDACLFTADWKTVGLPRWLLVGFKKKFCHKIDNEKCIQNIFHSIFILYQMVL